MRRLLMLGVAVVAAVVLVGCDSTGESDNGGTNDPADTDVTAVESTAETAATNAANNISDPTYSSLASDMGTTFSTIGSYFSAWDTSAEGWTQSGDTWTYQYSDGSSFSARWEVTDTGSGWNYVFYFDLDDDGTLEKFYEGTVSYDGNAGTVSYYNADGTTLVTASWTVSGSQVTYNYDITNGSEITMVTNTDGSSGTITITDGDTTETYTW